MGCANDVMVNVIVDIQEPHKLILAYTLTETVLAGGCIAKVGENVTVTTTATTGTSITGTATTISSVTATTVTIISTDVLDLSAHFSILHLLQRSSCYFSMCHNGLGFSRQRDCSLYASD